MNLVLQEVENLLAQARQARATIASHQHGRRINANAVLTVWLEQRELRSSSKLVTKLCVVDLAPCELVSCEAARVRSGSRSTALHAIVDKLAKGVRPTDSRLEKAWNQSKITRLLRDSLSGKCITRLVACVSGDISQVEQTLETLWYVHSIIVYCQRNLCFAVLQALSTCTNGPIHAAHLLISMHAGSKAFTPFAPFCNSGCQRWLYCKRVSFCCAGLPRSLGPQ